jgi:hypothetical protein
MGSDDLDDNDDNVKLSDNEEQLLLDKLELEF